MESDDSARVSGQIYQKCSAETLVSNMRAMSLQRIGFPRFHCCRCEAFPNVAFSCMRTIGPSAPTLEQQNDVAESVDRLALEISVGNRLLYSDRGDMIALITKQMVLSPKTQCR